MSLSAFIPSLGFVSASILVLNVLRVWTKPCVPLLGVPFSVVPEAFYRVLDPLVRLIVPGEYKPSWPRQTQHLGTLGVGQLTLPLTSLVHSSILIGIPMRSIVEPDTFELRRPWRWVCRVLTIHQSCPTHR